MYKKQKNEKIKNDIVCFRKYSQKEKKHMKNNQKKNNEINDENIIKYGETIPTNFKWIGLDKQKAKAKKLAEIESATEKTHSKNSN